MREESLDQQDLLVPQVKGEKQVPVAHQVLLVKVGQKGKRANLVRQEAQVPPVLKEQRASKDRVGQVDHQDPQAHLAPGGQLVKLDLLVSKGLLARRVTLDQVDLLVKLAQLDQVDLQEVKEKRDPEVLLDPQDLLDRLVSEEKLAQVALLVLQGLLVIQDNLEQLDKQAPLAAEDKLDLKAKRERVEAQVLKVLEEILVSLD